MYNMKCFVNKKGNPGVPFNIFAESLFFYELFGISFSSIDHLNEVSARS
jgi:hypothetical protein